MKSKFLLSAFLIVLFLGNAKGFTPNWVWAKSAGGNSFDYGYSTHTDGNGNVYLAGAFSSGSITFGANTFNNFGGDDIYVVKYNSAGTVLWAQHAGGSAVDDANAITTDASGNVYVTGYFLSTSITFGSITLTNAGISDLFVVKYDPAGNVVWAKSAGGTLGEVGLALATDASGNIYLSGYSSSASFTFGTDVLTASGSDDIIILKYNSAGTPQWGRRVGGASFDDGLSIATDASGNVYATGNFHSTSVMFGTIKLTNSGMDDVFVVKYNSAGNVIWAKSAGGANNDDGYGICTSGTGIFVTGSFSSNTIQFGTITLTSAGMDDMFMVKYDSSGTVSWAQRGGGNLTDAGNSICADQYGNIYVAGFFNSGTMVVDSVTLTNAGSGFSDIFILKLTSAGNLLWATSVGGTTNDQPLSITSDATGDVYISGDFSSPSISFGSTNLSNTTSSSSDIFIAKWSTTNGVEEINHTNPITVYPNPSSGDFTVSFAEFSKFPHGQLRIINSMGEEIYSKETEAQTTFIRLPGIHSAGVYFVQLISQGQVFTKRLVVE